jgi:NAD(P)-dependent dehydrogenase (short-subunit alcohol dehydrogenase family)
MTTKRKTILITGSTDGVGRYVAERLAAQGWRVIVHGRDRARGEAVVARITQRGGEARFLAADLSLLAEVRSLADAVRRDGAGLDALVNNAGIGTSGARRELSVDGFELRFAVNYLAGFLLARLLLPMLASRKSARIVNVASAGQQPIDFSDVMLLLPEQAGPSHVHLRSRQGARGTKHRSQLPASRDLHGHDNGSLERRAAD